MSANTYTQHYANGTSRQVRRTSRQGRKALPTECVKVPLTLHVTPAVKRRVQEESRRRGMSVSLYGEIALALFDIEQFSDAVNCSKT
jgi:hypothetical protein